MRAEFEIEPLPLDLDKMRVFLLHKQRQGRTYATLANYMSAFSYHFRHTDSENLTLSLEFKMFKSGLKREMLGARYPNQKEPFDHEWFPKLAEVMDLTTFDDRLFFFTITLAYSFFMRVSEVLSLRPMDVQVDPEDGLIGVHFWQTKTDQFAKGTTSYVQIKDSVASPARYVDVLRYLPQDQPIWRISDQALNSKLRNRLGQIGFEKVENYSFHSFRRGGL